MATMQGIHNYASNVTKPKIKNIYFYDFTDAERSAREQNHDGDDDDSFSRYQP